MTYQPGKAIRNFPTEVKLESIGPLFIIKPLLGKKQIRIHIRFAGQPNTVVPYELIPMLVIGNTYEGKETFAPDKFEVLEANLSKRTGEYQDDEGAWWITFEDSIKKTLHIRQLELAKVLFLHNPHMVRSALRPNGLDSLASARNLDDLVSEITFPNWGDYPASNLRHQRVLDHLTWLFFDSQAKRSFHSIYGCQQEDASNHWHFRFIPPDMNGWSLKTYGHEVDDSNFIVDSIKSLDHPGLLLSRIVRFSHPRFRNPIYRNAGGKGCREYTVSDIDPELNILTTPGVGKRLHRQHDSAFNFVIPHESKISVSAKEISNQTSTIAAKESSKEVAGVGHSEPSGSAQEFDYGINRSEQEQVEDCLSEVLPTVRFKLFETAIERLLQINNYRSISIQCVALPDPRNGNTAYQRTYDGTTVSCHIATVYFDDTVFVIVEVDTERLTAKKSLSTLVAALDGEASDSLFHILRACSENGVAWDKLTIATCATIFATCHHPHRERSKKVDDVKKLVRRSEAEYLESWVNVLNTKVRHCHDKIALRT